MTKDEALKLALEVLGLAKSSHNMVLTSDPPQSAWRYHNVDMKLREAITAIREALALPVATRDTSQERVDETAKQRHEQEPVAWGMMNDDGKIYDCICPEEHDRVEGEYTVPLYTTPPSNSMNSIKSSNTLDAQRKPLTDEEIYKIANDLFYGNGPCDTLAMCRAIEAAHGIKE